MAIKKVITVCPYCASGCKIHLLVENNKIVGAEGANGKTNRVSCLAQYGQHFPVLNHHQVRSTLAMDFHSIIDRDKAQRHHRPSCCCQRLRSHYSSRRFTIIYITGSRWMDASVSIKISTHSWCCGVKLALFSSIAFANKLTWLESITISPNRIKPANLRLASPSGKLSTKRW